MTRREFLCASASAALLGCRRGPGDVAAVRAATEFLESEQHDDGAWRSRTYGLLSGGGSLTALVTATLARVDPEAESVERGLAYLDGRREAGQLGLVDAGMPDYPVFTHALAVKACATAGQVRARDLKFLLSRQFAEAAGWSEASAPYGAWGMGAAVHPPPEAGHVDLSMTRHALEALRAGGIPAGAPVMERARIFVQRLQHADGGFHFSTVVPEANKAGRADGEWASYGTAVADGIRSLEALGLPSDASRAWLIGHHRAGVVAGFENHPDSRWKDGLWFYYAASAAPFLAPPQQEELRADLVARQRPDGSWANPEKLVKEDDPLIATPLAVEALLGSRVLKERPVDGAALS